ncbi:MAG: hypothetical protein CSA49_01435 [Gammaproteobacteria bacterium]|nr:MAG: hypothetical protein CSA49_01435 [Gammaproteobacteria bacterium]
MVVIMGFMMALPSVSFAQNVTQRPTGLEMTADVVLVRPLTFVGTVLGAGVFVVSLPFSALGGNVGEAADTLVVTPFKATFVRCLGCSQSNDTN